MHADNIRRCQSGYFLPRRSFTIALGALMVGVGFTVEISVASYQSVDIWSENSHISNNEGSSNLQNRRKLLESYIGKGISHTTYSWAENACSSSISIPSYTIIPCSVSVRHMWACRATTFVLDARPGGLKITSRPTQDSILCSR